MHLLSIVGLSFFLISSLRADPSSEQCESSIFPCDLDEESETSIILVGEIHYLFPFEHFRFLQTDFPSKKMQ